MRKTPEYNYRCVEVNYFPKCNDALNGEELKAGFKLEISSLNI